MSSMQGGAAYGMNSLCWRSQWRFQRYQEFRSRQLRDDIRFCLHFWRASTRSYANSFFLMRQRRASGSLYFKKLVEEMFIRWLNLAMVSRKYPGTGYDSDESWNLEGEACEPCEWEAFDGWRLSG